MAAGASDSGPQAERNRTSDARAGSFHQAFTGVVVVSILPGGARALVFAIMRASRIASGRRRPVRPRTVVPYARLACPRERLARLVGSTRNRRSRRGGFPQFGARYH
jgi:hypothetical protein